MKWTERLVASCLVSVPSISQKLLVVPNCSWVGYEADLLVIEAKRRIVDIEIKVSRSDFKADAKKEKWWRLRPWSRNRKLLNEPRRWPDKVWKHYYALPAVIWHPSLLDHISDASGVILVSLDGRYANGAKVEVIRKAKPNPDAKPISPGDCLDLARLLSLRYWGIVRKDRRIVEGHQPNQDAQP